jgi:hypothetical protein
MEVVVLLNQSEMDIAEDRAICPKIGDGCQNLRFAKVALLPLVQN